MPSSSSPSDLRRQQRNKTTPAFLTCTATHSSLISPEHPYTAKQRAHLRTSYNQRPPSPPSLQRPLYLLPRNCQLVRFAWSEWTIQQDWQQYSVSTYSTANACRSGEGVAVQYVDTHRKISLPEATVVRRKTSAECAA